MERLSLDYYEIHAISQNCFSGISVGVLHEKCILDIVHDVI